MDSLGVCFEKLLYVRGHPAGVFVFEKLAFLDLLDIPIFKKCIFLTSRDLLFLPKMAPQAKPLCPSEAKVFSAAYGG